MRQRGGRNNAPSAAPAKERRAVRKRQSARVLCRATDGGSEQSTPRHDTAQRHTRPKRERGGADLRGAVIRTPPSAAAKRTTRVLQRTYARLHVLTDRLANTLHTLGYERTFLVALLIVVGSGWGFAELADEVVEGDTHRVDATLLLLFRDANDPATPIGPIWLQEAARDITGLGGITVLAFITLASAGFLAIQGRAALAGYVVLAVGSGLLVSMLLKAGFARPRPDLVPHGQAVYTSSFPSSHAMLSAVTFLTLGALVANAYTAWRLKAYLIGLAALLTLAVGLSRVYLGVHWPTDVLGGWTAGAAWALACWCLARYLQRRGRLE